MTVRRTRQATTGFIHDFREFALKGNVVELAIAVVIGAAFSKIITSFVEDIVMPFINPLVPEGNWREATIGPGIRIGNFFGSIIDFIIIALVLFIAIRVLGSWKRKEQATPAPTEKECPYCLTLVPLAASRCRSCTSNLPPDPSQAFNR
ncbi:MAG: large conductance mechanosensitive channel protein MscL [Oculatellaceae cyanobacterium bins.114]|nr:large conductance mechanosensitive channel protein MscL [Oculatellaceae cyanobacterium bins.114]